MTADLKAMLDELMGKDRDLSLQEREKQAEHWSDESVCKYFLVKFCPHDLFGNTKADLGPCKAATHDVKIREDYRKSLRYKKMGYEKDFVRTLENTIDDMERKIKRQHERLEHDERYMRQEQAKADDVRNNRLEVLNTEIDAMLEKMAEAGSEGNVDEAQQMMKQVDAMRQEREAIKAAKLEEPQKKVFLVKQNVPFINEMKHMEVCPVCGAFLVVNDTQTRVDAHLAGKQHVGYKMIREAIKSIREELEADEKAAEEARLAGIKRVAEKDKIEESRVDDRVRSRNDREKSRDASRRRSRDISRSHRVDDKRDRDRDRYDRQDRSRDQRDRSRERRNRDRSRERRKSRDAGRSERKSSRDRSRERRSSRDRSRERGRKSSKERSRRSSRDNEPAKTTEKKEDGPATEENTNMEEEKHDNTGETKDDFSEKADKDMQNGEAQEEEKKTSEEGGETTKERRRSRSRDRRNRSRDRRSRSRDRKRDRSRDRSRRSRDRKSRERRRRSMSRERRRSRSYERKRSRH